LVGIATFLSTLLGGLFASHLRDRLHLNLGFSAGALIGVSFFHLIPEALELAGATLGGQVIVSIVSQYSL
jgi:ZIP family zinc transporter